MIQFSIELLAIVLELLIYMVFFHEFFGKAKFSTAAMVLIYTAVGIASLAVSCLPVSNMIHWGIYIGAILLLALCYQGPLFVKVLVPVVFQ
ncbi:MAG: hypothetical protein IJD56_08460, partial [Peptococcaceae bacterium]|nr:hypothetical protein [Peptococcaceae bacterium]